MLTNGVVVERQVWPTQIEFSNKEKQDENSNDSKKHGVAWCVKQTK